MNTAMFEALKAAGLVKVAEPVKAVPQYNVLSDRYFPTEEDCEFLHIERTLLKEGEFDNTIVRVKSSQLFSALRIDFDNCQYLAEANISAGNSTMNVDTFIKVLKSSIPFQAGKVQFSAELNKSCIDIHLLNLGDL